MQLEFIKSRFAVNDFVCAIEAANELATTLIALPGIDGIDARFSLRELALEIGRNTTYPSEFRTSLLKTAAFSAIESRKPLAKEEVLADVSMLIDAGKMFRIEQNDVTGGLDMLLLAIRLNHKLAEVDRLALEHTGIEYLLPETYDGKSKRYIDKVATLAEVTKEDKSLEWFREKIASDVYYGYHYLWVKTGSRFTKDGDDREVILKRCQNLLRLVSALDNISDCRGGCGGTGWRWRPIMSVAAAYEWLNMTDEGTMYIDKALDLVKNITDKDRLLREYRFFVLSELCGIHYRSTMTTRREQVRKVILSLADEMTNLANSLNTQNAKEVRESLEKKLKEANIIKTNASSINNPTQSIEYNNIKYIFN